jgi:cytochrome P450
VTDAGVADTFAGRTFLGTPATAPGPLGPDMLRAFSAIRRDPLQYLARAWREHGDVVQFPIPRPPSYLINDPDGVRRVLVGNARNYTKQTIQYRALSLVTGDGLLVTDGDVWQRQRALVQPAFHHETLDRIVAHATHAAHRMLDEWEALPAGAVVDLDAAMITAALEVVGQALFGTDLSADALRLAHATLAALDVVVSRARVPVTPPAWLPTPGNRRLQGAVRELDGAVLSMLAERSTSAEANDMLDLLLQARDESGARLTRREVRDQVVSFIVAGHETVASSLTWAWALLAAHPEVQRELQDEADAVLTDAPPTMADYGRLPVARAVLDEAMRLYPPVWLISRRAQAPDVLGRRDIPAGAIIITSPWLVHRHPDRWDRPDVFDPHRFLDGTVDRQAFIPFGAGPRQCVGRDFAYVEAVLLLATMARRVSVSYPAGVGIPAAEPLVTIRPVGGLPVVITSR